MKVKTDEAGITTVELTAAEKKKIADSISILRQVVFFDTVDPVASYAAEAADDCATMLSEFAERKKPIEAKDERKE